MVIVMVMVTVMVTVVVCCHCRWFGLGGGDENASVGVVGCLVSVV